MSSNSIVLKAIIRKLAASKSKYILDRPVLSQVEAYLQKLGNAIVEKSENQFTDVNVDSSDYLAASDRKLGLRLSSVEIINDEDPESSIEVVLYADLEKGDVSAQIFMMGRSRIVDIGDIVPSKIGGKGIKFDTAAIQLCTKILSKHELDIERAKVFSKLPGVRGI